MNMIVMVGVNNPEHAEIIKKDLLAAIKLRTTRYFVSHPEHAEEKPFIDDMAGSEAEKEDE